MTDRSTLKIEPSSRRTDPPESPAAGRGLALRLGRDPFRAPIVQALRTAPDVLVDDVHRLVESRLQGRTQLDVSPTLPANARERRSGTDPWCSDLSGFPESQAAVETYVTESWGRVGGR